MIKRLTLTLFGTVLGGIAFAQETVPVPAGCKAIATVHKNTCAVSTIFECGSTRQVLSYVNGKPDQTHFYDLGWGLTGFLYQANDETRFDVEQGSGEVMELSDLVSDGIDAEHGVLLFSTRVVKNRPFQLDGAFVLTEDTVELSGNTFRTGRLNRMFERENVAGSRLDFEFDIFVSEQLNIFLEGSVTSRAEGVDARTIDHTPRAISFADEPGFLAVRSDFGCE